ncbi:MAG: Hsp20/alpha crystallin family protein [Saprospiraceae bacterium]|nr:Hsp20/alpha crystallin family protein [Saprospiraceae bacterium]
MNKLRKYNPSFRGNDLFSIMDEFFNPGFSDTGRSSMMISQPKVNVKETDNGYTMELAVPGMKKEDFDVQVDNDHLIVSANVSHEDKEETDNYTRREFNYSSFERRYYLPDSVDGDNIVATYNDGILSLEIPKVEEAKPKKKLIEIK